MLERTVEAALVTAARDKGGRALKWVSPGLSGVPDRIVLLPVADEDVAVVARYVRFVECKSPRGRLSALQGAAIRLLVGLGYVVQVVASPDAARGAVE